METIASLSLELPEYNLTKLIGSGSRGTIFQVTRIADGHSLAAKIICTASSLEQEEAVNEIAMLKNLNHPGVVRIMGSRVSKNHIAIVTELCSGGSVGQYTLRQPGGRLSPADAMIILKHLLETLHYLDHMGVIHRDIKPANILLRDTNVSSVVLCDFGAAVRKYSASAAGAAGTELFMAPEIAVLVDEPCNDVTASFTSKADIWSLGITLFTLLSGGVFPVSSRRSLVSLARSTTSQWQMPSLPADVPCKVVSLIQEMLTLDPHFRPSAAELLEIIHAKVGVPEDPIDNALTQRWCFADFREESLTPSFVISKSAMSESVAGATFAVETGVPETKATQTSYTEDLSKGVTRRIPASASIAVEAAEIKENVQASYFAEIIKASFVLNKAATSGVVAGAFFAVEAGYNTVRAIHGTIPPREAALRTLDSAVGAGGGYAGAVIGQAVIPVPVVGAVIGGLVGGIVGRATSVFFSNRIRES